MQWYDPNVCLCAPLPKSWKILRGVTGLEPLLSHVSVAALSLLRYLLMIVHM